MVVTTTALGRQVPIEDWVSIQGDQILRAAFDMRRFGKTASAPLLRAVTGLHPNDVWGIAERLAQLGLVAIDERRVGLTENGLAFVTTALASARS